MLEKLNSRMARRPSRLRRSSRARQMNAPPRATAAARYTAPMRPAGYSSRVTATSSTV